MPRIVWITFALLGACAPKVQVAVPAMPAIDLDTSRVAVVAGSHECRAVADALVAELNQTPGITVDPRAHVRLEVIECDQPLFPVEVDVEIESGVDRRRLSVEGSAHALVAVRRDGAAEAHLIGATRRELRGAWGENNPVALSKAVEHELVDAVAADLADQLRPVPLIVERRVYANPTPGTPQETFNLAVKAESEGRLHEAHRLAALANDARPSPRTEAYLAALDALIARYPYATDAVP